MVTDNGRLSLRDQQIWEDFTLGGKTLMALAEEHDVSYQRIGQIIKEIREKLPEEDKGTVVGLRLEQIKAMTAGLLPGLLAGNKDAIASWKIIADREAKYLGLDSAEKVELSGGVRYEVIIDD